MFYRPGLDPHGLPRDPFKALLAPRPIAWVSTLDADGRANLAPFSYFNGVADSPPIVMFAPHGAKVGRDEGKDTLANVLATGEFVVNLVGWDLRDAMNATSGPYPPDVDEFDIAGLEKAPCRVVAPPRVAAAPAAFECRFLTRTVLPSTDPNYDNGAVFGEVVGVHIREDILTDGRVDMALYQPIARLGYADYAVIREVFQMIRPKA